MVWRMANNLDCCWNTIVTVAGCSCPCLMPWFRIHPNADCCEYRDHAIQSISSIGISARSAESHFPFSPMPAIYTCTRPMVWRSLRLCDGADAWNGNNVAHLFSSHVIRYTNTPRMANGSSGRIHCYIRFDMALQAFGPGCSQPSLRGRHHVIRVYVCLCIEVSAIRSSTKCCFDRIISIVLCRREVESDERRLYMHFCRKLRNGHSNRRLRTHCSNNNNKKARITVRDQILYICWLYFQWEYIIDILYFVHSPCLIISVGMTWFTAWKQQIILVINSIVSEL